MSNEAPDAAPGPAPRQDGAAPGPERGLSEPDLPAGISAPPAAVDPGSTSTHPDHGQGQHPGGRGGQETAGPTHGSDPVPSPGPAGQPQLGGSRAAEGSSAAGCGQPPDQELQRQPEEQQEGQTQQQEGEGQQQQQEQQEQERPQLSDEEALALAESLKREGNDLFGRGLWDEAAAKYNEALDAAPESAKREQAIYFANLAACNIKSEQYAAAVQNCTEAIQLDPSYQKAYMRRCEAFERLDELDHALSDAKKLLELAPDSGWAKAKVAALQPVVEERAEKLKAEMMSKLKDLGNTILGKFGLSTDNFKFDKDPNTGGYSIRFER